MATDPVALEENARRVDAALAEIGFGGLVTVTRGIIVIHDSIPDATAWRAVALSDPVPGFPCWPCREAVGATLNGDGPWEPCDHDWRIERWPEIVR